MYLFQVSICTLICYLVYHFLYQNKTNHTFNRVYLITALLLSSLFPLLQIPVFPEYIDLTLAMKTTGITNEKQLEEVSWWTLENMVFILYAIGVMIHLMALIYRLYSLYDIIKKGEKKAEKDCTKVYTDSGLSVSSFLFYLIIPTEKKDSITAYELEHEKNHIRQKHSLDILFLEFFRLFYWFNPILIFYKKRMVEVHEYLADESTVQQFGQADYEAFLIQQVTQKTKQSLVHNFYSLFKNRINMMNSKVKTSLWQYLMMLPMVALSLFLFSFDTYPVYNNNDISIIASDTIPGSNTEIVDTIIMFDPETKTKTMEIVRRKATSLKFEDLKEQKTGIDTVIVFDPDTYKETIFIMNHETGKIDTIR